MDKDSLKPVRIKVGQAFSVPVSFIGEPAPECIWEVKGMVGVKLFTLDNCFILFSLFF